MATTIVNNFVGKNSDIKDYLMRVYAADGEPLETGVANAIGAFISGCKTDGNWNAIKASCILAGARTLNGALVPLKITAPTNSGFVSADYNRKTGLLGNGATKFLNTNRRNDADPINSKHVCVYQTTHHSRDITRGTLGTEVFGGGTQLLTTTTTRFSRVNVKQSQGLAGSVTDNTNNAGFWGASRNSSTQTVGRYAEVSTTYSQLSQSPNNGFIEIFRRGLDYSNGRISFYSIGEGLDLALLDARITTLMNALNVIL
jgi:hypothetical protein